MKIAKPISALGVVVVVTMVVLSCGNRKAPRAQVPTATINCKLGRGTASNLGLGFPKTDGFAPAIGAVNMAVLFVDFKDVPASKTVDSVFSIINPIAPDFFEEISYGRMQLKLQPYFKWLRLSQSSEFYGRAIYRGQPHLDFIQEAVNLADNEVDFSQTDIVLVITNPDAQAIRQGPTFKSLDPDYFIRADGAGIRTGITSGYDLNYWGGIWLPHETGHSLSLPDLYHFGQDSLNRYVGTFGLMGTCDAKAPGYFAFERWMLGWIDDHQIYCHDNGEAVVDLTAMEISGGTKAIMVPLSKTTALVIESRRKIGVDHNMVKEGALVYVVDTALEGGSGPIRVKPGVDNGNNLLEEAPMLVGDIYSYQNVSVEVVEANTRGDKLKIKLH
ncbi:MAG: hypothetical protein AAF433_07560 [Bacteroidota bacterium]